MRGSPKPERQQRARQMLQRVGLAGFEGHYPEQLSGGMQQRVNLARVLVNRPPLLLMDEPFGALDAQTRLLMQQMLLDLWQEFRMTVIFITHDIDEAIFLSDRLIVLTERPGGIKAEIATGLERPRNPELLASPEFMFVKTRVHGVAAWSEKANFTFCATHCNRDAEVGEAKKNYGFCMTPISTSEPFPHR
jgi:NitT/TauT family transport system ATP-binding protein